MPPSWHNRTVPRKALYADVKRRLAAAEIEAPGVYQVNIHLRGDWFLADGHTPARRDCVNFGKVAEDAVMQALSVNDCRTWRFITDKRPGAPSARVIVRKLAGPSSLPPEGL